jgi:predicted nucleic acid binding AN1-type Zn finger protein
MSSTESISTATTSTSSTPNTPIVHHKKSNRCHLEGCNSRVVKIVGHCRYCQFSFCSTHRLPETHNCANLDFCKQTSFEKNSTKLLREKCVKLKV